MNELSSNTQQNKLPGFLGQERIVADIKQRIDAVRQQKRTFANLMFNALPEMGKMTLALAVVGELGVSFQTVSSSASLRDLASAVTGLRPGDILLVEEIGFVLPQVKKALGTALEDFTIDVTVGKGSQTRSLRVTLPQFSVIATTSKLWQVEENLRRWFIAYDFDPYSDEDIRDILIKIGNEKGVRVDSDIASALTPYCKGTPGNAAVLIKRLSRIINSSQPLSVGEILHHLGLVGNHSQSVNLVDRFMHMSGQEFEQWVAHYCRQQGYEAKITETTGDHGIDLLLRQQGKLVGVIQCKRWNDPIGEPVVRDFYGALMSIGAPTGYIFATTSFTPQARAFAHGKPIQLIGLDDLIEIAKKLR